MRLPQIITNECSEFLNECQGRYLLKSLNSDGDFFRKVKIREKNKNELFIEAFNINYPKTRNLFQRALFANGRRGLSEQNNLFYVFPINGYKYLYNSVVNNSYIDYKDSIDGLRKMNISESVLIEMFAKTMKNSYKNINLVDGIESGAEIIVYDIPYYYGIEQGFFDNYIAK